MSRESLPEALRRQAEEAHERALRRPRPWWVRFDPPARGLFAATGGELVAVCATLVGMREPVEIRETTDEAQRYVPLDLLELLVCDEANMRALMSAVRRSGLHGTYRQSGTDKEYGF